MTGKKLKLLVCCGNGAGTSMMIKLNVEKVAKKMGLDVAEIRHCAVSEGKSAAGQYDVVLCSKNFVTMFADAQKNEDRWPEKCNVCKRNRRRFDSSTERINAKAAAGSFSFTQK